MRAGFVEDSSQRVLVQMVSWFNPCGSGGDQCCSLKHERPLECMYMCMCMCMCMLVNLQSWVVVWGDQI